MKKALTKLLVIILCVPMFPVYVTIVYIERNSYLGDHTYLREIVYEYLQDVWEVITHKGD